MSVLDYTTYDEIRAVLGVSTDELEDSTLALGLYLSNLIGELEDIDTSLPGDYAVVAALSSRSALQQRFYEGTRLFAAYAVAKQLGSGLPLFGPKDITDGKASTSRFADSPYKETLKAVSAYYERTRGKLESAYADLNAGSKTTVARTLFVGGQPSSNPVTGT